MAAVASARNVGVGGREMVPALRIVQELHGCFGVRVGVAQRQETTARGPQRPDSMDESVLFDIQDPFQIDTHRLH